VAQYAWLITEDQLTNRAAPDLGVPATEASDVGSLGPRDIDDALLRRLRAGDGAEFRLCDGDGAVCFTGRYLGPDDHRRRPLDEHGTPSGCTTIEYRHDGDWRELGSR
jgi:hypothetical protein